MKRKYKFKYIEKNSEMGKMRTRDRIKNSMRKGNLITKTSNEYQIIVEEINTPLREIIEEKNGDNNQTQ